MDRSLDISRWVTLGLAVLAAGLLARIFIVFVKQRVAAFKAGWRWQQSVQWTNLGILILALALSALMGLKAYLLIFLERCHRENPLFAQAKVLRLRESLRTIRYRLWDEERQRLVGVGVAWL